MLQLPPATAIGCRSASSWFKAAYAGEATIVPTERLSCTLCTLHEGLLVEVSERMKSSAKLRELNRSMALARLQRSEVPEGRRHRRRRG